MKTKKFGFLGILLALMMMASLLPMTALPVAADPGTNYWTRISTPATGNPAGNVTLNNSELTDIAVTDGVIYVLDSVNNNIYKSGDGGRKFSALAAPSATMDFVAVCPSNANIVVVADNTTPQVWLSTDGGSNWNATGFAIIAAGTTIQDIAISPTYPGTGGETYEIATAEARLGDGAATGGVQVLSIPGPPFGWMNQALVGDMTSVAYSPMYAADKSLLCISNRAANITSIYLNGGVRNINAGTTGWNTQPFTGFPAQVGNAANPSLGAGDLATLVTSISMPSDFFGPDATMRRVYASYVDTAAVVTASQDVYRIDNTTGIRMNCNFGANVQVWSVAFSGTYDEGNLLAGMFAGTAFAVGAGGTTNVRRCADAPSTISPNWKNSGKAATGAGGQAVVAWNKDGDSAYCITSTAGGLADDESAFSHSSAGSVWNQYSLVDTTITNMTDVAACSDTDKTAAVFLATVGAGNIADSVWRSTTDTIGTYWERVVCKVAAGNNILVRPSTDYGTSQTAYYMSLTGAVGTQELMFSANGGETWKAGLATIVVVDLTSDGDNTIYATSLTQVSVSKDNGWTWSLPVSNKTGGATMITTLKDANPDAPAGYVFVGGALGNGFISYSTNGGSSFTRVTNTAFPELGAIQVAPHKDFASEGAAGQNMIFVVSNAAGGSRIARWVIGKSTVWSTMQAAAAANRYQGLVCSSDGTLYAGLITAQGGMDRTIYPTGSTVPNLIAVQNLNFGLAAACTFTNLPQCLKLSETATANDLWAVRTDVAGDQLFALRDTISNKFTMGLTGPGAGDYQAVDPASGRSYCNLDWEPVGGATQYVVQLATEEAFSNLIVNANVAAPASNYDLFAQNAPLQAGKTYYWRARVSVTMDNALGNLHRSPWSEKRKMLTEVGSIVSSPYQGPQPLAPVSGASGTSLTPSFSWSPEPGTGSNVVEYNFVLSANADMSSPLVDETVSTPSYGPVSELDYETTYFWQARAINPMGSWGPASNFTTKAAPLPLPAPEPPPATPAWVWVVISLGAVLVVVTLVLIFKTRRA